MRFVFFLIYFFCFINGQGVKKSKNSPLSVLARINKKTNIVHPTHYAFNINWVDSLKLLLPCKDVPVPKRTMRLPNAPRDYRNGIHRGVDFFANWGTPVMTVANGVVIRADRHYKEVAPDFREKLLESSSKLGNTPSDIFNNILLGKAVFIDHGFELIPGFRTISIYAHLSYIEENIYPGIQLKQGEVIGKSGNTGMRESTLGSKAGSHLHWEMILQKDKQEIFLGKDMSNPELYNMLLNIFN